MYFKPLNLARQSFIKTFTHGYAQSLVAATQTSSASQNTSFHGLGNNVVSYFGRNHSSTAAQHGPSTQPIPTNTGIGVTARTSESDKDGHDGGLAAYYAAWQKHHRPEEKEWHQFQFAKRIGWKAPTTIPEPQQNTKPAARTPATPEQPKRAPLERTRSSSALDDLRKAASLAAEEVDASFAADQVTQVKEDELQAGQPAADAAAQASSALASESATSQTPSSSFQSTLQEQWTPSTSFSEAEPYTEHLVSLAEAHRYSEIPAVFEALLNSGVKPTVSAYNALLVAAINFPRPKHHVVPKALDVYSDMLRRRIAPDTATYAILIELLAARALDVTAMRRELDAKRSRFNGLSKEAGFMFQSDETEYQILTEDDSLSLAIRLFDTSAAMPTNHRFSAETYRLILLACAEHDRIGDMVRIYADMESQNITPPTAVFAPMIGAFARIGDLRSSVECYEEYKSLAMDHDSGIRDLVRKDEEVYAAIVKAYAVCGRMDGGLRFLDRIETSLQGSEQLSSIRDTVAVRALHPEWLGQGNHAKAVSHALDHLNSHARSRALSVICIDAADKGLSTEAQQAFQQLASVSSTTDHTVTAAAMSIVAMHMRKGDLEAGQAAWHAINKSQLNTSSMDSSMMYSLAMIQADAIEDGLRDMRPVFNAFRRSSNDQQTATEVNDKIDEAIQLLSQRVLEAQPVPSAPASVELLRLMVENDGLVASLAERLLGGLGPAETASLKMNDVQFIARVQAGVVLSHPQIDASHAARFSHLVELMLASGAPTDALTAKLVDQVLPKLNRPDLAARWQGFRYPRSTRAFAPAQQTVAPAIQEDSFDPYAATTDFRGSNIIAEELEKTHGRHINHLNDALAKFRNMRRAGRHPRYITYAKLINAAAKENKFDLVQEILAMARQDVPLLAQNQAVRHGWTSILDAVVGACLTLNRREVAAQFHQELLNIGAAPSANTFGLYITTLKETTKTFDEATEAVKIFQRAKSEGIEPTSFLYNALIGKLGKARRIDDCLFYFAEMRNRGIRPTSVTYGTIVNALCRVSDSNFAEELFEEMEAASNYKPRPAPYNSLMQYFLTTKRDRSKVLAYYERMRRTNIQPTMHTYKLLIDTHATLEPIDMRAAEDVLDTIRAETGSKPEAVHYASLIHAKGCAAHDAAGAQKLFDQVLAERLVPPQASLYQALFESLVANHEIEATDALRQRMRKDGVALTPYIANTLIHGWALAKDVTKARAVFDELGMAGREPSTYEAMTRAYLAAEEHGFAKQIVGEALRRGYPAAVAGKICDLVGGGKPAEITAAA